MFPYSNGVENYLTQPLIQSRSSSSIQRLAIETGKPALSIALWLEIGNGSIEVDTTLLSVSSGTGMNLEVIVRQTEIFHICGRHYNQSLITQISYGREHTQHLCI